MISSNKSLNSSIFHKHSLKLHCSVYWIYEELCMMYTFIPNLIASQCFIRIHFYINVLRIEKSAESIILDIIMIIKRYHFYFVVKIILTNKVEDLLSTMSYQSHILFSRFSVTEYIVYVLRGVYRIPQFSDFFFLSQYIYMQTE